MAQFIGAVALVVPDYDEAIAYYTEAFGFELIEDSALGNGKRWVLVAPPGSHGTRLLLARAATPAQRERVGDQTGGRVFRSCTPTIFGATTPHSSRAVSNSSRRRARKVMAPLPCSRIAMGIAGICCS